MEMPFGTFPKAPFRSTGSTGNKSSYSADRFEEKHTFQKGRGLYDTATTPLTMPSSAQLRSCLLLKFRVLLISFLYLCFFIFSFLCLLTLIRIHRSRAPPLRHSL